MNVKLIQNLYDERRVAAPEVEQDIADVEPANPLEVDEHSLSGLIELLLKAPLRVDAMARDESRQTELIPRFLGIALFSFSIYSLGLVLLLNYADHQALPEFLRGQWSSRFGPAFSLWAAYTLGLVAATGICLPSFYFFGLLAGVRVSAVQVTGHVMKGKASTAVMLLGILPIYVAVVLGMIVFHVPTVTQEAVLYAGLGLPFVAGLWGVWSIYRGFQGHSDSLPACRRERRACFLRRLTFAWSAVYSAVTPVMIYTLWNYFVGRLA